MGAGDSIFALASGAGRAGLAVLRISGPAAVAAFERLSGRSEMPKPRQATLATLRCPESGEILDRGLVIWFPAPTSFTGEPVLELHLHGGRAVLAGVAEALGAMAGVRPAEAGEFSRRAFLNGKMDLTEAEGLADLVAAETRAQRRQALRQLDGGLSRLYDDWRQALIEISAEVEAAIDFSDEADVPAALEARARTRIGGLLDSLRGHLDDGHRGERLRDGFYVAILGPPNVGKSSLLNALARRDAAIVAATAGTTRDVVEVQLDLGGYPAIVADTAGLRETADAVEDQGVRRALARAAVADLKLVVVEAGAAPAQLAEMADLIDGDSLTVVNKCDMESPAANFDGGAVYRISVKTGDGVAALLSALGRAVAARLESAGAPSLTRARHRTAATEAVAALERAAAAEAVELLAEDLRSAARALGRITGRVDVEDILDVVFASFCIGK